MASHRKVAKNATKTILIQIATTPEEHAALVAAANADGRSLRQFVKWNALRATKEAK